MSFLVIVAPDGGDLTPDDLMIVPAATPADVEALWDLHDGRNLGTMVVAVYRLSDNGSGYVRDESWGLLGDPRKTRAADPEDDTF